LQFSQQSFHFSPNHSELFADSNSHFKQIFCHFEDETGLTSPKALAPENANENKKIFLFLWYFAHLIVPLQS
jgi:hypothetical protein